MHQYPSAYALTITYFIIHLFISLFFINFYLLILIDVFFVYYYLMQGFIQSMGAPGFQKVQYESL